MANLIGFTLEMGNLPEGWEGTPQELLDKVAELLNVKFDDEIAIFKTGTTQPDSLTNQAWLRDGNAWYVPDEDGNWVPVEVDDRIKRIYVRSSNPFDGAESDAPRERSLWLRTNTVGNEARELSVYLNGAWRSLFLVSAFVDLQNLAADNQSRIDSVIESTEDGGGLKDEVVGPDNVTDGLRDNVREYTLDLDTVGSIASGSVADGHKFYVFVPSGTGLDRLRSITAEELTQYLQSNISRDQYVLAVDRRSSGIDSDPLDGGEWNPVPLTEVLVDETDGVALAPGAVLTNRRIVLPVGTWRCDITMASFQLGSGLSNSHNVASRLRRVEPFSQTLLNGTQQRATHDINSEARRVESVKIVGQFELTQQSELEIQAFPTAGATRPVAAALNPANEGNVFTFAQFWRIL